MLPLPATAPNPARRRHGPPQARPQLHLAPAVALGAAGWPQHWPRPTAALALIAAATAVGRLPAHAPPTLGPPPSSRPAPARPRGPGHFPENRRVPPDGPPGGRHGLRPPIGPRAVLHRPRRHPRPPHSRRPGRVVSPSRRPRHPPGRDRPGPGHGRRIDPGPRPRRSSSHSAANVSTWRQSAAPSAPRPAPAPWSWPWPLPHSPPCWSSATPRPPTSCWAAQPAGRAW